MSRNAFFGRKRFSGLKVAENFGEVKDAVTDLMSTEDSYYVRSREEYNGYKDILTNVDAYSGYGISSCGSRIGFPANFLTKHAIAHHDTVRTIMDDCYSDFFERAEVRKDNRSSKGLLIRSFDDEICGVLTDKYSIFDDDEVINLLEGNDYLMGAKEFWYCSTSEHFHARFVSQNTLDFDGDDSPLHFCVFVDNSMVGESSLRIRFGLYRSACTNGCIFGFKEFEIVKECHKGEKDYSNILRLALSKCSDYEETLLKAVKEMAMSKSAIYGLEDEVALAYLRDKLNIGKKACGKILDFYKNTYKGESKWDLCNAITEYAHEVDNISDRVSLERLSVLVA